jgi:alpha-1,2-mannosyltransferase
MLRRLPPRAYAAIVVVRLMRPARSGRAATALAIVGLAAVAAVAGTVHGAFTDLMVYRWGGGNLLDGVPLYESRDPSYGLHFTYPPFAAVLMSPLALLPATLVAGLWTAASMAALAGVVVLARRAVGRPTPAWMLVLLAVGAVGLEPVWQTLAFGQINLLVMLALLLDLLHLDRRWSGALVGIAAGVKLTPLVFVVLLAIVGCRTAAGRALLAFVGTVVVGFVAAPGSSATYWTDGLVDAGRVGPPALAHNQSVYGALTRLLDGESSTLLWLAVAGPLALAALLVGAAWWRRGDRLLGSCLAGLAMLIASPVSWSHHWVWAVPVALAVWERSRLVAVAWTAVFVARPILWPPWGQYREYGWTWADHVVGNAYLLEALAIAAWAAVALSRSAAERVESRHVVVGQREVGDLDVGSNPVGVD